MAWIGLGFFSFTMVGMTAELSYHALVKGQIRALQRDVLRRHPRAQLREISHARFGTEVLEPVPSLLEDILAWFPQRGTGISRLDHPNGEFMMFVHAYTYVGVHLVEEGEEFSHTFIWSPRLRRFVHHQNWGLRRCDPSACRWALDPPRAHAAVE